MKARVLRELLEWAEAQDAEVIFEAKVIEAAPNRLTEEQAMAVNTKFEASCPGVSITQRTRCSAEPSA